VPDGRWPALPEAEPACGHEPDGLAGVAFEAVEQRGHGPRVIERGLADQLRSRVPSDVVFVRELGE